MKDTIRLIIFLVLTFVITWALEFLLVKPILLDQGIGKMILDAIVPTKTSEAETLNPSMIRQSFSTLFVAAMMFIPALCVLLTRLITKEGFRNSQVAIKFKSGRWKPYVAAWFLPAVLCTIGAVVFFLVFPGQFDTSRQYLLQQYIDAGMEITPEITNSLTTGKIITGLLVAVFLSPLLNAVTCFGEEWGWRGYMMPKLLGKVKFLPAVIIGGIIWGLWHAPLIALGHNYGTDYAGAPWLGIAMMCLFCVVLGTLLTWWSMKAGSVWPAVIGHGAINGFAGMPLFFMANNNYPLLGPTGAGLIGGSAIIVAAIVVIVLQARESRKNASAATVDAPVESTVIE